jgi:hypothetical protein
MAPEPSIEQDDQGGQRQQQPALALPWRQHAIAGRHGQVAGDQQQREEQVFLGLHEKGVRERPRAGLDDRLVRRIVIHVPVAAREIGQPDQHGNAERGAADTRRVAFAGIEHLDQQPYRRQHAQHTEGRVQHQDYFVVHVEPPVIVRG